MREKRERLDLAIQCDESALSESGFFLFDFLSARIITADIGVYNT